MQFPQYRKLKNRSYYKIVSESELFELQKLGKKFLLFHLVAKTFLDRNFISQILQMENGLYEVILEAEFESIRIQFGNFNL